jgi:hypothetical protein
MSEPREQDTPIEDPPRRAEDAQPEDPRKERVPAEPIPQRPGEAPIGNGGTDRPAAFPPHN